MDLDTGDGDKDENLKSELVGDASEIITSIARFHNNQELSDVVLKLGTQCYHAHKFVLLLMSDVFRTMCSKRWDGADINEIELNECEQCVPVFPLFLHFLYHGQVYVKTTTALPLLMLADKYNVQPLKHCCESYIRKQVEGGNVVGAIRWLPYLQLCEHEDLEKACIEVIIVEMEYIINCNDFLLLNFDLLLHLLERNDLVVPCEYVLYTAVVQWIEDKEDESLIQKSIDTLIPTIRFSMMFPDHLILIERSQFFQRFSTKIAPYIALAHRFRSLIPDVVDEAFSGILYYPRNYTNSAWCHYISLDADNVSFFNKSFNLLLANNPLPSAVKPVEPTWHFQVQKCEKQENSNSNRSYLSGSYWHSHQQVVFDNKSNTSNVKYLSLQVALRPLKPISTDVAVDVALFRLKKDSICKQLDAATYIPLGENMSKTLKSKNSKSQFSFPITQDKNVHSKPIQFSFTPAPVAKEQDVSLRYNFQFNELECPPEVPCVQFGPGFGHAIRPIHSVKLAIIVKPRYKLPTDVASTSCDNESVPDTLPILG